MKSFQIFRSSILIVILSSCTNKTDYKEADDKLLELYSLYDAKKFNEVDSLLEQNREYVDKYDLIAAVQLHRNIMRIQNNTKINFKYPEIIPPALFKAQENSKTTYLSQSYQEYILSLQGTPKFIDGFCPAEPVKDACYCRIRAINNGVSTDYFFAQRDMFFSEYLYKMCPNDALKAIHVFSSSVISENKAIDILVAERKIRSEADFRMLESFLCNYKNIYSDYEAPYLFMENTDLVDCD